MESTQSQSQPQQPKSPALPAPCPANLYQHRPLDPDEINLLEYIFVLVKNKWWIIGAALLGLIAGYGAAMLKGPTWISESVIAPRESETQKLPNFSGLGAFGGMVASQLNMSGNPGLEKIDIILESRKFNAEVIERNNLLPFIYKHVRPEEYKEWYDSTRHTWKDSFALPNLISVGNLIRKEYLKKETKKNNTLHLSIMGKDSLFVDSLMTLYIKHLNNHIQTSVQSEAHENVSYLENHLITVSDPLLQEKLQTMIAGEMEKAMLVSKEAFQIIDPPYSYKEYKEKKLYPIVFFFAFSFIVILIIVLSHALIFGKISEEDKNLITGIGKEIRRIV